ncbi:DUF6241 domain-containing protein [Halobacillus sp. Marseille-Q1614]|uniref:DUF6241 domain-containing protein n=1 Tax=Halobacillus sp. Marseille-Q1614 TaxID=2709134 RepID=UPI00156E6D96|nr:DUF6241 domain-containing protein [Halobacillus sp. Marseille-Q1614]
MSNKVIGLTISILICFGVAGAIGYMAYDILMGGNEEAAGSEETEKTEETEGQKVEELSEDKLAEGDAEELIPFGDQAEHEELTDRDYQEYIHQMSHQKVKAGKKWGFYLITDERVNWLLEGLETADLKYKDKYAGILNTWQDGDFSSADEHHNAMWSLQGGTVGRSFGVLSEAEEEAFIESSKE